MTEVTTSPVTGLRRGRLSVVPSQRASGGAVVGRSTGSGTRLRARPTRLRLGQPVAHLLAAVVSTSVPLSVVPRPAPLLGGVLVLTWLGTLSLAGCYARRPVPELAARALARVLRAGAVLGLGCWLVSTFVASPADERSLAVVVLTMVGLTALSTALVAALQHSPARLVLAGAPEDVDRAMRELRRGRSHVEPVVACVTEKPPEQQLPDVACHLGVDDAVAVAIAAQADALLLLPGTELSPVTERRLEWAAARRQLPVYLGTSLLDVAPSRMSVLRAGGMDLLHVRPCHSRGLCRMLTDLTERMLAALVLVATLPVLLVVAAAIRFDSPGSALFRQPRVGRNGRLFTMYKFRTMRCDAAGLLPDLREQNEADGVLFKLHRDPRITGLGAVLRRYSVDELPQLWNVVLGQMSLVGPRPALPEEVAAYDLDPRHRLEVKPGMTGLWQVSGRSDLSWEESVRLDLQYVDNWSPGLDLAILCRTIGAVLRHRGAY